MIFGGAQIIPQRENGNLRMLGVTTAKRMPGYEDIPAIGETVPGYAIAGWAAVLAPKGTPAPIVGKINADMRQVLEAPEVVKRLHALGQLSRHGGARHAGGAGEIHPRRFRADGAHPQGRQPAARGLEPK